MDTGELGAVRSGVVTHPQSVIRTEVAVIGSGPGGAVTARFLSEAGFEVLVLEDGPWVPSTGMPMYSSQEMEAKYRNGGLTAAIGAPSLAYVEGRCVGGGSEVNGGLWFRPPRELVASWDQDLGIRLHELDAEIQEIESTLFGAEGPCKGPPTPSGAKLHAGAHKCGWSSFDADCSLFRSPIGIVRRGMSSTYLDQSVSAGCRIIPDARALRIQAVNGTWRVSLEHHPRAGKVHEFEVRAQWLFLAAGAVHTPALLRRSGLASNAGSSLGLHATIKVVARFEDEVNPLDSGPNIPSAMIDQFAPEANLECAVSGRSHLALELAHHPGGLRWIDQAQLLAGYAARAHQVKGRVRTIPGFLDPFVSCEYSSRDRSVLMQATKDLCRALLAAGATHLWPALDVPTPIRRLSDVDALPAELPREGARPMTIHLTSSCRMGRESSGAVADAFGRIYGEKGLYVADGSMLPTPPRVNPQATIMGVAQRNARIFAAELGRDRRGA